MQNVFISLGEEGVIYGNKQVIESQASIPSNIINTIGAGDSFVSGIVYADSLNLPIHQMARIGMQCASLTVEHDLAVSPKMCVANLSTRL